jgi:hypothetical protein
MDLKIDNRWGQNVIRTPKVVHKKQYFENSRTLGEILVDKANQGVQVYVMVWSEKTSGDILGEKVLNSFLHHTKVP